MRRLPNRLSSRQGFGTADDHSGGEEPSGRPPPAKRLKPRDRVASPHSLASPLPPLKGCMSAVVSLLRAAAVARSVRLQLPSWTGPCEGAGHVRTLAHPLPVTPHGIIAGGDPRRRKRLASLSPLDSVENHRHIHHANHAHHRTSHATHTPHTSRRRATTRQ